MGSTTDSMKRKVEIADKLISIALKKSAEYFKTARDIQKKRDLIIEKIKGAGDDKALPAS